MDADAVKWLASLGVGGVLAGGMFLVYRKDAKEWQAAWKGQMELMVQVIKENTAVITSLVEEMRRRRDD